MQRGPLVFIIVILTAIGGFFAYDRYVAMQHSTMPTPTLVIDPYSGLPSPPAGARVMPAGTDPETPMLSYAAAKGQAARDAEAANWKDQWLPPEGWEGGVEQVTQERDGIALRIRFTSGYGGDNRIVVVIPDGREYSKGTAPKVGDRVRFGGRLDTVEELPSAPGLSGSGGPLRPPPEYRVVVRDGWVISINGR